MSAGYVNQQWSLNGSSAGIAGTADSSVNGQIVAPSHRSRFRRATRPRKVLPSIRLNGVTLHSVTETQGIHFILDELDAEHGGVVVTPNLDHLRRCEVDLNFGALVAEAQLVVADGMPLVWASRLQGTPLPERVAGSNMITSLTRAAGERGRSVFFLGGAPGTAEGAAKVLKQRYPEAIIAGTFYPPEGFEYDARLIAQMEAALLAADPDIVYVALGSPKQERLIGRLKRLLPHAWWLGVGVSFSFLTGDVKRAPLWMQRTGIEWMHRLVQEPRRLFKRYIVIGLPYAGMLFTRSAVRGLRRRFGGREAAMPVWTDDTRAPSSESIEVASSDTQSAATNGTSLMVTGSESPVVVEQFDPAGDILAHEAGSARMSVLSRLRGFILLGGSVRQTPLGSAIERSVLDLPVGGGLSILNHWLNQSKALAELAGIEKLPVRILVDRTSFEPQSALPQHFGRFRVERDLTEYRGTGGVLRDLADSYADDDYILVANATQVLLDSLPVIAAALERKRADVSLVSHQDGTPSGLMLIRCKTLRDLPATGFVDMKEQALPSIAAQYDVRVVHVRRAIGSPVWSLQDYIGALRQHHGRRDGRRANDPLAEDWQPVFSVIEEGATVDPTARIHDAVVLKGARVEAGALIVRSIVCAGAVVSRDVTVVDQFVKPIGGRN